MTNSADHPGVIAPPPLLLLGSVLIGVGLSYLFPVSLNLEAPLRWGLGLGLVWAGLGLEVTAFLAFRKARTDVRPWKPTTAIAPTGPYQFTRNPMYLGMILLHLGAGVLLLSPWVIGMAVPFALVLHYGVVLREEAYLTAKFGESYLALKARVRRWV
jgi:protein-S-isoprenylcysteine O-methyltransferase Ste14